MLGQNRGGLFIEATLFRLLVLLMITKGLILNMNTVTSRIIVVRKLLLIDGCW